MAKVRAQRRAERERKQKEALEYNAKRLRRRMLWRKVTLHEMRRRSSGRLFARRSRGERALIGVVGLLSLVIIWTVVPSMALKVLLSLLLLLALPALVIVAFDRRNG
ncbi:MAG TPA: hypothetical protein VFC19_36780 [Candidatus Limnocylindrales bacterium]|nr:hypothetical protein [Candidatus Limnocylindrales bacterium]